ncbi:MAG TPA: serine hydrolase [Bryobacteraceae bacterium]|nr:serine hydrolase [Bryobacteraceae bacterium]
MLTFRFGYVVLIAAAMSCLLGQAPPPLSSGLQQVVKEIDRTASDAVNGGGSMSFALAAVTRDGVAWTKSYGNANAAKQTAANSDTEYRMGSAAFTALMLLQLVHDGKVHLSDRVDKYFPEIKLVPARYPDAAPLSLVQLATDTTGLELDTTAGDSYSKGPLSEWEKTLIAALPHVRYTHEPGIGISGSNVDDAILAAAVSRAAEQSYVEYVRQRILAPLGMTHTDFEAAANAGLGYTVTLHTTVADLAKFAQFAMMGGPETVLPKKDLESNYRRMWLVNSVSVPNPTEGAGIGYEGETWTSNRNSHYYFILPIATRAPGYQAALWIEPRTHAGVILLQHGDGPALGAMIHSYVYTLNAQKVDAGRQEPERPYPYREEEVAFENTAAGIRLSGTLTIPEGKGPFPAVVLVQPMGPFDRDEPVLNHRPFLVLSDHLTRRGVAVLRYDVRGTGKSGGKFAGASRSDVAGDLKSAVAYLRSRPEIEGRSVGLIGHLDGGRTAAMVVAQNPEGKFLVLLSTAAVPAADTYAERTMLNSEASGESYENAEKRAAEDRKLVALVKQQTDPAVLEKRLAELLTGTGGAAQVQAQIKQWTSAAFRKSLLDDPAVELRAVTCPVLALFGEKDLNVPVRQNAPAMRKILEAAGDRNSEVQEFSDLNVLLQTADTGLGREAFWAEETMAPVALEKIASWILKQVTADGNKR